MAHMEKKLEFEHDSDLLNHYLQSDELKIWPLLSTMDTNFLVQIEIVMWYGKNDEFVNSWPAALIVTKDKNVYSVSHCRAVRNNVINAEPRKIKALCQKNIKTIINAGKSFFLLTEEGKVYYWGIKFDMMEYNTIDEIQYIDDTSTIICCPIEVSKLADKRVVDIKCGYYHVLVLTDDKKVYSWGKNSKGQVGHIDAYMILTPIEVIIEDEFSKKDIQSISCGHNFSMAVTCNGELYGWGQNMYGQLGLGINGAIIHRKPTKIMIDAAIAKVECGSDHTLALTREGLLYVWGKNDDGQLGIGNSVNYVFCPIPMDTREIGKITDIAARFDCSKSVILNRDNRFYLWGLHKCKYYLNPIDVNLHNIHDAFINSKRFIKIYNPCTNLAKFEKLSYVMSTRYLKTIFNSSASADVELIVDEKSLYVHKIVIMVYCPEMYKKFFCHRQHETDNVIIRDDFCFATYRSYLKYLYTDVIVLPPKLTLELHDLAMCYDDLIFKAVYMMKIKEEINILNVLEFYAEAISRQIKDLEEFCFKYAINNLSIVVKTEGYANLSEKIRFDFIIKAADAQAFRH